MDLSIFKTMGLIYWALNHQPGSDLTWGLTGVRKWESLDLYWHPGLLPSVPGSSVWGRKKHVCHSKPMPFECLDLREQGHAFLPVCLDGASYMTVRRDF